MILAEAAALFRPTGLLTTTSLRTAVRDSTFDVAGIGPESIELKLLPQLPGQPARAPLPSALDPHLRKDKAEPRRHRLRSSRIDPSGDRASVRRRLSSSNTLLASRQADRV